MTANKENNKDDFDLPFNDDWQDEPNIKALMKQWPVKLALTSQIGNLKLSDDKQGTITAFLMEMMLASLGQDGMDKLYEHFDGDDTKVVEWFSKKAKLSSVPNQNE
jgi:hypothetical protein